MNQPPSDRTLQSIDAMHQKRVLALAARVEKLLEKAADQIAKASYGRKTDPEKPFSFDDYPGLRERIGRILASTAGAIHAEIQNGTEQEWTLANIKNDQILQRIMATSQLTQNQLEVYQHRNTEALAAFQNRKEGGMDLSQRVWKYVKNFKGELELALDLGLGEGASADRLSREVRQHLRNPDALFRRVRDKHGNLVLSQRAREYHPGRGVYRSAYKNAMRLTRTETNMAYRDADHLRMQQFDFVVGYEVRLSANRPPGFYDICDELKGRYPKQFKFRGWHPHCLCHVVTILATPQELAEINKALIEGRDPGQIRSRNAVTSMPPQFHDWMQRNQERAARWASQPYFIRDNFTTGTLDGELII